MIPEATTVAVLLMLHSPARRPRKRVALEPNQAGTKQQTSLRDIFQAPPIHLSVFQITTEVICMPGYMVVPTGRPSGYQTL